MAEMKKKKQHFVPRFYLKLFADETHKFYVYDLLKKDWEYYHEQYEVTLNGEDRVVVNKDGHEIVIF